MATKVKAKKPAKVSRKKAALLAGYSGSDFKIPKVKHVLPDPQKLLTFAKFRAWVKKQAPAITFVYSSNSDCAIARFFKAHGYPLPWVYSTHVGRPGNFNIPYDIVETYNRLCSGGGMCGHYTFGALAQLLDNHHAAIKERRLHTLKGRVDNMGNRMDGQPR